MTEKLKWGIIGCGRIARKFAAALAGSETGGLYAAASRDADRAENFAQEFGAAKHYPDYGQLLADPGVDAVYIATPHPMHRPWVIRAAAAGKHILCEKPLAVNAAGAVAMIEAAREHGVFLMEAFMYRCHAQSARIVELVSEGSIGEVRLVRASFGYQADFDPRSRTFNHRLAGGGILDVGCYPVSFARMVAGAALGRPFADPVNLQATGHLTDTRVDGWTSALLTFPDDILAEVSCAVQLQMTNEAWIFGSDGMIHVPQPWQPGRFGTPGLTLHRRGAEPEKIDFEDLDPYMNEADTVAANLEAREAPAMTWADTLGNMKVLDAWRSAIGQHYDFE